MMPHHRPHVLLPLFTLMALILMGQAPPTTTDHDQPIVHDISWPPQGFVESEQAKLVEVDGQPAIRVEKTNDATTPLTVQLLAMDAPAMTRTQYTIRGRIRYENVTGLAYLEMWSHFPDGSYYFSRTLDNSGPRGKFEGTSSWRWFEIPFDTLSPQEHPSRLTVNLILKGTGTVEVATMELVEIAGPSAHAAMSGVARAHNRAVLVLLLLPAILIGAVLCLAMIIALARGRFRGAMICLLTLGILLAAVGLLLFVIVPGITGFGALIILAFASVVIIFAASKLRHKKDDDDELRRIQAMDVP